MSDIGPLVRSRSLLGLPGTTEEAEFNLREPLELAFPYISSEGLIALDARWLNDIDNNGMITRPTTLSSSLV